MKTCGHDPLLCSHRLEQGVLGRAPALSYSLTMMIKQLLAAATVALVMVGLSLPGLAAQDDPRLDDLFVQLHNTNDDAEAQLLQSYIWLIWIEAHDDELNAMMQGGTRAMQLGDLQQAIGQFTRLIDVAPEFAEAWNKRATVYFMIGRYDESIADCMEVLALEPRHFGALSGLGLIYSARDDSESALFWFREALEQNPHMPSIRQRVEELSREVEGEAI
ncbi:MAG: tetratricopeptide repeat protein [Alphaproteobacteria bacterium]|jgi:tetratricopeptide (TPR) repeat protein|nr:tetratricopeptide repeat protein [Rhodospirillaceae bacterium]MBT7647800.1 tetratricopeptide repeat protein [Rhodospirillaceae bacterium]MDG2481524.1 tetratricopeptide repeat protein [Alphaproteobacteria bacterium]